VIITSDSNKPILTLSSSLLIAALLILAVFFVPWKSVEWGKFQLIQPEIVVVSGTAKTQQKSQIATFSVGVTAFNDSKDDAIDEVNTKIAEVIKVVESFGIEKKDIKTENMSIYQQRESYWEDSRQKSRPGQWSVSNNVSITLRDIGQAGSFADGLAQTGATNIYGPNFASDNQKELETGLIEEAIRDATSKAETMAGASGRTLGKIVSVTEGATSSYDRAVSVPLMIGEGGGGGAEPEPGSTTIYKTVTVTFELK
jgi:uncharacterized protein YggE